MAVATKVSLSTSILTALISNWVSYISVVYVANNIMANPFADKFSHFTFFLFIHVCFSFEQNDCKNKSNTFGWAFDVSFFLLKLK